MKQFNVDEFFKHQAQIKRELDFIEKWEELQAKYFDRTFINVYETLSEEQREEKRKFSDSLPWNYYTDRKFDLEDTLREIQRDYYDWHWEKYGFNAY